MIQIFTLILAANEAREVAVTGEYFELRNAIFPIALIELLDRTGSVISRLENPEQSDYVNPGRYETIRITNGPTAQAVRHFYGSGDAGSRRTSGLVQVDGTVKVMGDVSVIDGEKSRTLAGGSYAGNPSAPAVAAQYSFVQLWNPAGSGKNLIVNQCGLMPATSGASGATLYFRAVALGTNKTATTAANKRAGGTMGVATVRSENSAVVEAFPVGSLLSAVVNVSGFESINMAGPVVVPPGYGLTCTSVQPNLQLWVNFEWFEEPI